MSLADRRKRIEEKSSGSGRRESIDSFVSYRNSRFDEEDREERISRGDLTQEERKGGGVSSPLSDENRSTAAERAAERAADVYRRSVNRDKLETDAFLERYGYKDAVNVHDIYTDPEFSTVSKLERFELLNDKNKRRNALRTDTEEYAADALKRANESTANMRKAVTGIDKYSDLIDKYYGEGASKAMKEDLGTWAQAAWGRSDYASFDDARTKWIGDNTIIKNINGATASERTDQYNQLTRELDEINKYVRKKGVEYATRFLSEQDSWEDPADYRDDIVGSHLENDPATGGQSLAYDLADGSWIWAEPHEKSPWDDPYLDSLGQETGRTYRERKEEIEALQNAYGLYDRGADLIIANTPNIASDAKRTGFIEINGKNQRIAPENVDLLYDLTPEDVAKYYDESPFVRWLVATGEAIAPEGLERDVSDEAALINSEALPYKFLSEEEKRNLIFNLHINPAETNRALKDMQTALSSRNAQFQAEYFKEGSEKFWAGTGGDVVEGVNTVARGLANPVGEALLALAKQRVGWNNEVRGKVITDVVNPLVSGAASLATTPISFLDALGQSIPDEEGITRRNPYSPYQSVRRWSQGTRATTAQDLNELTGNKEILGMSLGDVYNAAMSSAESLAAVYTMGPAYTVIMGMGAATDEMNRLAEEGANNGQQVVGGIFAGVAEAVFEHVSLEQFTKSFIRGDVASWREFIKDALIQAGVEGSEEFFTEVANNMTNQMVMGTQSEWDKSVRAYKDQGLSEEDAYRRAWVDRAYEYWKVTAEGALSGGMMAGGGAISSTGSINQTREAGAQVRSDGYAESLRELAGQMVGESDIAIEGKGANAVRSALRAYDRTGSDRALGNLQRVVAEQASKADSAEIGKVIERNGVTGENANAAHAMFESIMENAKEGRVYEVTAAEKELLKDEKVQQAYADLFGEKGTAWSRTSAYNEAMSPKDEEAEKEAPVRDVMTDYAVSEINKIEDTEEREKALVDYISTQEKAKNAIDYTKATYVAEGAEDNGAPVRINSTEPIARYEGSDVVMNTDRGEVKLSDLALENDSVRDIVGALKEYGPAYANAVLSNYNGEDAATYIAGMKEGITKAIYGIKNDANFNNYNLLSSRNKRIATELGEAIRDARMEQAKAKASQPVKAFDTRNYSDNLRSSFKATRTGANGSKGAVYFDESVTDSTMESDSSFGELTRTNADAIKGWSDISGSTIVLYDSKYNNKYKNDNGFHVASDGSIWVDIRAGADLQGVVSYTLAHELTHEAQQWAPEAYKKYCDFLIKNYTETGTSVDQLVQAKMTDIGTDDYETAFHEVIADASEKMLLDSDAIEKLQELRKEDPQTASKVISWIRKTIAKLKKAYADRGFKAEHRESELAEKFGDKLDEMAHLWSGMVVEAAKARKAAGTISATEARAVASENVAGEGPHSQRSLLQSAGFKVKLKDGLVFAYDKDGNRVTKVTTKHIDESGIGALINYAAREGGTISKEDALKQKQAAADLINMILNTQQSEMVWRYASATMFSAIKSNSDHQYGTTVDFTTVCRKTQEMITAMSEAMKERKEGLRRDKIIELQQKIVEEGGAVPCPVCYVFSRWAGIGGILDNMRKWQEKYGHDYDDEKKLNARIEELERLTKKKADLRAWLKTPGNDQQYMDLSAQLEAARAEKKKVSSKLTSAKKSANADPSAVRELEKYKDSLTAIVDELAKQVKEIESNGSPELAWLKTVRNQPGYWEEGVVSGSGDTEWSDILFDLDKAEIFAETSPLSWAFRTSRGPAAGKAILPYSEMVLGDLILGPGKTFSAGNETFYDKKAGQYKIEPGGQFNEDQRKKIESAIKRTLAQNLIGGQRFQSTSDFRYDYGLDYLQVFWEAQALGSTMQTYTKIIEFGELAASVGGDVNLSVMPLDAGYKDGHLIFSSVTGIDYEAAAKMSRMFPNVQLILVGINDEHIRLALEDSEETGGINIGFVIPYHASGASINEFIRSLVSNLGENFNEEYYKDYSFVQTDSVNKARSKGRESYMRALRKKILTQEKWAGGKEILSPEDRAAYEKAKKMSPEARTKALATIDKIVSNGDAIEKKIDALEDKIKAYDKKNGKGTGKKAYAEEMSVLKEQQEAVWAKLDPYVMVLLTEQNADINGRTFEDLRDVETRALAGDPEAIAEYKSWSAGVLGNVFEKMFVNENAKDTYGVKLTTGQAAAIMPHEYWNKAANRANAYVNGFIFRSYCYNLGLTPRFTGINSAGKNIGYGDFSDSTGYWKTLIDRPMYDLEGNYRDQQKINATAVSKETLQPSYADKYATDEWNNVRVQEPDIERAQRVGREYGRSLDKGVQKSARVTAEQNARYMELAKDPEANSAELERMVEKAARDAGYSAEYYHGTQAEFNSFDIDRSRFGNSGYGIYLGDKWKAAEYGGRGKMLRVYANTANVGTLDSHKITPRQFQSALTKLGLSAQDTYKRYVDSAAEYVKKHNDWGIAYDLQRWAQYPKWYGKVKSRAEMTPSQVLNILRESLGIDGIERMDELVLWDNTLVKSADPVTYDDQGNVIPLTERFNEKNEDIRYSRRSAQATWEAGDKLTKSQFYSFYSAHKLDMRKQGNVEEQIERIKSEGFKGQGGFGHNLMSTSQYVSYPTIEKYNRLLELEKEGVYEEGHADKWKAEQGDEYGKPEPSDVSVYKYGPRKGDYILLVPKPGAEITKSVDRVRPGWKPQYDYEIVRADYDYQPYYEMYSKAYDAQQIGAQKSSRGGTVSTRQSVAQALQDTSEDSVQYTKLSEYLENVEKLDEMNERLDEVNRDIYELTFTKDKTKRDPARLKQLREEQTKLKNNILTQDNKLVRLMKNTTLKLALETAQKKAQKKGFERATEIQKTRQAKRETKAKLKSLVESMRTRLLKPTENKYIPQELRSPVADLLGAIDLSSGRASRVSEELASFNEKFKAISASDSGFTAWTPAAEAVFNQAREAVKGVPVRDMTPSQLQEVYNALKTIDYLVRDAARPTGMIDVLGEERSIKDIGNELIQEAQDAKKRKYLIAAYVNQQLRPSEFFETLAGYKKGSMWSKVYQMLDNAQRKQIMLEMESNEIFKETLSDMKYVLSLSNTKDMVDVGLRDKNGDPYQITRGMMLSLYMHLQNEDNMRHIMVGGLKAPNMRAYYHGKSDAYTSSEGQIPGVIGEELANKYIGIGEELEKLDVAWEKAAVDNDIDELERIEKKQKELRKSYEEVFDRGKELLGKIREKIEEQLTDKDRAFVEQAREFFDVKARSALNEATMRMYGFEKANVENYFPIHSNPDFLKAEFTDIARDFSIQNASFMKDRIQGTNPIMLEDFASVINRQIQNTARYAALAPAIRDFEKMYNARAGAFGYGASVQSVLADKTGTQAKNYIQHLLRDLNGGKPTDRSFIDVMRSWAAGAVLTMNPRVSLVQSASYITAAAELGYTSLAKALILPSGKNYEHSFIGRKAPDDLIKKYTAMLWTRKQGYIDVAMGEVKSLGQKRQYIDKKMKWLTGWIQAFDTATVGRLWYASEYYVKAQHPEMKDYKNSGDQEKVDEYYTLVAEAFNNVIEKTQPNYTTMQRPEILRNPNAIVRGLTMFMTQRLQNVNIMYGASKRFNKYLSDYNKGLNGVTKADVTEAAWGLYRAMSSQILSAATIAGMRLVADFLLRNMRGRRDDDDELTQESIATSVWQEALSSFASNFLGVGEIYDIVEDIIKGEDYDGLSVGGVSAISDFGTSVVKLFNKIGKGTQSGKDFLNVGNKIAAAFGIPSANAYKIANALKGWAETFMRGAEGIQHPFDYGSGEIWETGRRNEADKQKAREMVTAFVEGNTDRLEEIRQQFTYDKGDLKGQYNEDKANEAFKEALYEASRAGEISDENAEEALRYIGLEDYEIEELLKNWQGKDVTNRENELYKEYEAGNITFDEAVQILADEGMELTDKEKYNLLGKWESTKATGKNNFKEYEDLKAAYSAYVYAELSERNQAVKTMKETVKRYKDMGYSSQSLVTQIGNTFRDRYKAADKSERARMKPYIIQAYKYSREGDKDSKGHTYTATELEKAAKKLIEGWEKED